MNSKLNYNFFGHSTAMYSHSQALLTDFGTTLQVPFMVVLYLILHIFKHSPEILGVQGPSGGISIHLVKGLFAPTVSGHLEK